MGIIRTSADRKLVQGTPVLTICFYVLGPLPQAIKIFGVSGLPWTETWVALLFMAWLVEIVIRFCAGLPNTKVNGVRNEKEMLTSSKLLKRTSRTLNYVAFIMQVLVWLWILLSLSASKFVKFLFGFLVSMLAWYFGICILLPTAILALPIKLLEIQSKRNMKPTMEFLLAAAGIIILFSWTALICYCASAAWSQTLLLWLVNHSEPVGFVVALPVSTAVLWLFVLNLTRLVLMVDNKIIAASRNVLSSPQERHQAQLTLPPPVTIDGSYLESGAQGANARFSTTSVEASLENTNDTLEASADIDAPSPNFSVSGTNTRAEKLEKLFDKFYDLSLKTVPMILRANQTDVENRKVLAIVFALANLTFTALYYCFKYSPEGTTKPGWTEMLG